MTAEIKHFGIVGKEPRPAVIDPNNNVIRPLKSLEGAVLAEVLAACDISGNLTVTGFESPRNLGKVSILLFDSSRPKQPARTFPVNSSVPIGEHQFAEVVHQQQTTTRLRIRHIDRNSQGTDPNEGKLASAHKVITTPRIRRQHIASVTSL